MYVVVRCPRCGEYLLANTVNKTRSCPHCGHRSVLRGLRVLGRTESSRDAVAMIQELKRRRAEERA
jgi:ribosomal protein S27AE